MPIGQLEDELGDIIGNARFGSALTVDRLAELAGVSTEEVLRIENYTLLPDDAVLNALADVLELDSAKLARIASASWLPAPVDASSLGLMVMHIPVQYGSYGVNSYILACPNTRRAAVIDPGGSVDAIHAALDDGGMHLDLVLLTHSHADHTGGLPSLLDGRSGVKVISSRQERDAVMRGVAAEWIEAVDEAPVRIGQIHAVPLSTPGHTSGSICFAADGVCFVGDTLFAGSIGRPSGADAYARMLNVIRSRLLSLPGSAVLYPGHGPATTAAEENLHNPFFRDSV